MSYDLMIFDPDLAPRKQEIENWFSAIVEAERMYDSTDPDSAKSTRLRLFYDDMRQNFPAMNGPDQSDDFDSDKVTGYDFHPGFVYMDFRWSAAELASNRVLELANKHRLGLFDPQEPDDGVILEGAKGDVPSDNRSWWAKLLGR